MRSLIVFYSRTGNTRKVARGLAEEINADLAEIACRQYPRGPFGYLKAGRDSMKGRLPDIEVPPSANGSYDLVVIGAPVWVGHPALPIRAFLSGHPRLPAKVALFLTRGGSNPEPPMAEMEALLPSGAVACMSLKRSEIGNDQFARALRAFAEQLQA